MSGGDLTVHGGDSNFSVWGAGCFIRKEQKTILCLMHRKILPIVRFLVPCRPKITGRATTPCHFSLCPLACTGSQEYIFPEYCMLYESWYLRKNNNTNSSHLHRCHFLANFSANTRANVNISFQPVRSVECSVSPFLFPSSSTILTSFMRKPK